MSGLVAKEIRALLMPWVGCLAMIGAGALANPLVVHPYFILVVVGGACALGALSLGHEYTSATLASMLAQPVGRVRVLAVKTAVLVAMLAALFALYAAAQPFGGDPRAGVIAVATLAGLCLAPWLTILTRSPLAGALFGISILGMTWALLNFLMPATAVRAFWPIASLLGVASVALTWRGFMRLQVVDGRGPHVHMAWNEASAAPRLRRAVVAVLRKELALQQLPLVLAAIYVVGSVRLAGHAGEHERDVFGGLTVLFSGATALLIGSIAGAEERQLGTLDWHQLLPMASWKQWSLKVGTAIALTLALGVALPAVMLLTFGGGIRLTAWYVASMVLLSALGLYVASLTSSSLRALAVSAAVPLVLILAIAATRIVPRWPFAPFNVLLAAAFVVLLLGLAFDNHRRGEWNAGRVCAQLFILCGCLALELAIGGLVVIR